MPVTECQRRLSHREFLTWREHLKEDWEHPNKTEFYLMQLAAVISKMFAAKNQKVDLNKFKLSFKDSSKKPTKEEQELIDEMNRIKWLTLVGLDKDGRKRNSN
jgi:hypothetical protein